jgi:hypothetical protein
MSLIHRSAAAVAAVSCLVAAMPVQAYDLQFRQNNSPLTSSQLQEAFNRGLPRVYDQQFPDQQWTTYLLLDAHPDKGMVAITVGLSPRVGASKALLPIATFSALESIPLNRDQWITLVAKAANAYATNVLVNRGRILSQR